jgi:hypothetical protein
MQTTTLRARVQYNDWVGTSAVDNADGESLRAWLVKQGLMKDEEFLLAFDLWVGENHGAHKDPISCHAFVVEKNGFDTVKGMIDQTPGPVPTRRIDFNMNVVDFLALFKRFSVSASSRGILDPDREISY